MDGPQSLWPTCSILSTMHEITSIGIEDALLLLPSLALDQHQDLDIAQ